MKLFSTKSRRPHLGPYPLERLARVHTAGGASALPPETPLSFDRQDDPNSIVNAMRDHQAMMDAIRVGRTNPNPATIPHDPTDRAHHLKAFGYFTDASMAGIGTIPDTARLDAPTVNADVSRLIHDLKTRQTKSLAAGMDIIMAELAEGADTDHGPIDTHTHTLVFLHEHHRDPRKDEPGTDWIQNAQAHRAAILGTESAVVIANYIRLLGFDARAHTPTASDVHLGQLALAAGLVTNEDGQLVAPYLGTGFGLTAITTTLPLTPDLPLLPMADQPRLRAFGPAWWLGYGTDKSARNRDPYRTRDYRMGAHPFETLKRKDQPTTYIDEPNVPRVPKRADLFARAQFGDMGAKVQNATKGGAHIRKSAPATAQRTALGAFTLLQDGPTAIYAPLTDAQRNGANLRGASYFLGADAVGLSRCPEWTWYSHDARGDEIDPPHDQAVSMIIDQGFETTEGTSGDDWISVSQSMRAYLRFSLVGGVLARHIRDLGYPAKAHSVMDGEVLQPPLLLLAGLGEVSRIGEVILNPFLGPRLKSGAVTTTMPMDHDKPVDFGLQSFCESCNKCARECPSGAITAGPKLMFNGYEIWKSDSQKCATYRITNLGGSMCGRCMKTCPWNLEGLFAERPFRWAAMTLPKAAPALARLDDMLGNGEINPVKTWWWDLELNETGGYGVPNLTPNARPLQRDLDLKYEDQTLAVYPAPLAAHPYPYPDPMDREAGIEAYQAMITAEEYRERSAAGDDSHMHRTAPAADAPVVQVIVDRVTQMTPDLAHYRLVSATDAPLPPWTAGGHLDVVVTPDLLRQYSLCGDPADRSCYEIAVLREPEGRGGSQMLHRLFTQGRRLFVSKPINHFQLVQDAPHSLLMGGGIGITPMIAFAHRLHALGRPFDLHYSVRSRSTAGFISALGQVPWRDNVHLYISDEGTRADLDAIMTNLPASAHLYTCGPEAYMAATLDAGSRNGFDDDNLHAEYFSAPETPDYVNTPFTLRLKDGREFEVAPDATAADTLNDNGISVDVKCSDGICGVCKCALVSGDVEHRDFVLSKAQRETNIILCQSRASQSSGIIEIDL